MEGGGRNSKDMQRVKQGGILYHFSDGLWYDLAVRSRHPDLSHPDAVLMVLKQQEKHHIRVQTACMYL